MTEPENFEDDLFADLYVFRFLSPISVSFIKSNADFGYSYDDNEPAKAPAADQSAAAPPALAANSYEPSFHDTAQPAEYGGPADNHVNNEEYEEDDDEVDFNLGNGTTATASQHADTPTYSTPTPVTAAKGPNAKEDG